MTAAEISEKWKSRMLAASDRYWWSINVGTMVSVYYVYHDWMVPCAAS